MSAGKRARTAPAGERGTPPLSDRPADRPALLRLPAAVHGLVYAALDARSHGRAAQTCRAARDVAAQTGASPHAIAVAIRPAEAHLAVRMSCLDMRPRRLRLRLESSDTASGFPPSVDGDALLRVLFGSALCGAQLASLRLEAGDKHTREYRVPDGLTGLTHLETFETNLPLRVDMRHMTRLRSVALGRWPVDLERLLCSLTAVHDVCLPASSASEQIAAWANLMSMPLRVLHLHLYPIPAHIDLADIAVCLPALRDLSLTDAQRCEANDDRCRRLWPALVTAAPHLRRLDLSCTFATAQSERFRGLSLLTRLTHLQLRVARFSNNAAVVAELAPLAALRFFEVDATLEAEDAFAAEFLAPFAAQYHPALTHFVTDVGMETGSARDSVARLTTLEHLDICLDDPAQLPALPHLTSLVVRRDAGDWAPENEADTLSIPTLRLKMPRLAQIFRPYVNYLYDADADRMRLSFGGH